VDINSAITLTRVMEAVEAGDSVGFCLGCGHQNEGLEPDARGCECENCGRLRVYGAEELLLMGWVS
jgi:hypothetical protein